ncbi:MAG: hypothetical protein M3022_11625 [Actinomycetota bacterium]|nr:hypothetical protein [Actinomycetota bacterium]
MDSALAIPQLVAALVLCVAGAAKLRAPGAAARAVGAGPQLVRLFAAGELGLGAVVLAVGGPLPAAMMTVLYSGFAVLTLRLARAGEACGCFGDPQSPASPQQSALSGTLAAVCLLGAIGGARSLDWILGGSPGVVTVLGLGTAGAVYGIVLAYSELPQLWRSWSPDAS